MGELHPLSRHTEKPLEEELELASACSVMEAGSEHGNAKSRAEKAESAKENSSNDEGRRFMADNAAPPGGPALGTALAWS